MNNFTVTGKPAQSPAVYKNTGDVPNAPITLVYKKNELMEERLENVS